MTGDASGHVIEASIEATIEASIEAKTSELLARCRPGATICPSQVARALYSGEAQWRALMPQVRQVAQQMALKQLLVITQRGRELDPAEPISGAIRLGRS